MAKLTELWTLAAWYHITLSLTVIQGNDCGCAVGCHDTCSASCNK
jgi:hypothetical protein